MIPNPTLNPMQGGAGASPEAGGPPSPMGQPGGQLGAPPPVTGAPGAPPAPSGMPQSPGGGINAAQLIARAQMALKAGQISPAQFQELLAKLGVGGGAAGAAPGAPGAPPAQAAMRPQGMQQHSPAWG